MALFFLEIEDTLQAEERARKNNGLWNSSQEENPALTKAHQSECALALCVQLNFRIALDYTIHGGVFGGGGFCCYCCFYFVFGGGFFVCFWWGFLFVWGVVLFCFFAF